VFSDPQSITVNAVAQSMPRISQTGNSSVYKKADGTYRLEISHQATSQNRARNTTSGIQTVKQNIVRSLVRFVKRAIVADPVSSANDYEELQIQLVVQRPEVGFTTTDLEQVWAGFKTWADNTAIDKVFGLES
jgi:hypothetical protein